MSGYRLRPKAKADLQANWIHSDETWGEMQARAYLRMIERAFKRLAARPAFGRSREDVRTGYRSLPIGAHVIFYRPVEDQIEIVRVLHQRMDVSRQF